MQVSVGLSSFVKTLQRTQEMRQVLGGVSHSRSTVYQQVLPLDCMGGQAHQPIVAAGLRTLLPPVVRPYWACTIPSPLRNSSTHLFVYSSTVLKMDTRCHILRDTNQILSWALRISRYTWEIFPRPPGICHRCTLRMLDEGDWQILGRRDTNGLVHPLLCQSNPLWENSQTCTGGRGDDRVFAVSTVQYAAHDTSPWTEAVRTVYQLYRELHQCSQHQRTSIWDTCMNSIARYESESQSSPTGRELAGHVAFPHALSEWRLPTFLMIWSRKVLTQVFCQVSLQEEHAGEVASATKNELIGDFLL